MQALVLAAGKGTRLKPYTDILPKCLMPVQGVPVLDFWLQHLRKSNITELFVNTHYRYQDVEQYLRQNRYFVAEENLHILRETTLLGTAGTLLSLQNNWSQQALLVAHGDNVFNFDIGQLIKAHYNRPAGALMTMALFRADNPSDCGVVCLDENKMVQQFLEKVSNPPSNLANAAIYIFQPEAKQYLIDNQTVDYPYDLSQHVIPQLVGKIFGYEMNGELIDIGNSDAWRKAQELQLDLQRPSYNDWYQDYLHHPIHQHLKNHH